jgi:hypothetical protein
MSTWPSNPPLLQGSSECDENRSRMKMTPNINQTIVYFSFVWSTRLIETVLRQDVRRLSG